MNESMPLRTALWYTTNQLVQYSRAGDQFVSLRGVVPPQPRPLPSCDDFRRCAPFHVEAGNRSLNVYACFAHGHTIPDNNTSRRPRLEEADAPPWPERSRGQHRFHDTNHGEISPVSLQWFGAPPFRSAARRSCPHRSPERLAALGTHAPHPAAQAGSSRPRTRVGEHVEAVPHDGQEIPGHMASHVACCIWLRPSRLSRPPPRGTLGGNTKQHEAQKGGKGCYAVGNLSGNSYRWWRA